MKTNGYVLERFRLDGNIPVKWFQTFFEAVEYAEKNFILDYVVHTQRRGEVYLGK